MNEVLFQDEETQIRRRVFGGGGAAVDDQMGRGGEAGEMGKKDKCFICSIDDAHVELKGQWGQRSASSNSRLFHLEMSLKLLQQYLLVVPRVAK